MITEADRFPSRCKNTSCENAKRLDIQGLRAVAAFSVIIFHSSSMLPGGFLGVDIFFVISGYLVTAIAESEIARTGHFKATNFIVRRLRRIYPPMIVVVAATLCFSLMIDTPGRLVEKLPANSIAALASIANIYYAWNSTDYFNSYDSNPLLHLWSLSIEIQFYILFAASLLIMTRKHRIQKLRSRLSIALLVTILSALSFLASIFIPYLHFPSIHINIPAFSFFMLPTRLWEFGIGILACISKPCLRVYSSKQGRKADILQIIAFTALLISLEKGSSTDLARIYQPLAPCLAVGILIALGERGPISRALSFPLFTFFGDRSYSIYLWQGPIIVFSALIFATPHSILLAAILSVAVAVVLSRRIESLLMTPFSQKSTRKLLNLILLLMAGFLPFIFMVIVPHSISPLLAPEPMRATSLDKGCQRQRGTIGINPCIYGPENSRKALLIGDSHAGASSEAFLAAANRAGWQAHIATASACSVPEYFESLQYRGSCIGYVQKVLKYAQQEGIRVVVIQQFSEFYIHKLGISLERWENGLFSVLSILNSLGISAMIINDNISFPAAVGRPLWTRSWRIDAGNVFSERIKLNAAENRVTNKFPGNRFVQSSDYLCEAELCPVFDERGWLYTDSDHLSFRGAEPLSVPIYKMLSEINIK